MLYPPGIGKQYIGSAKDFYIRLNEHLNNKKSNPNLQKAFEKYGLDKFNWIVYEYFSYETKILSNDGLTRLETSYIKALDFSTLYNMKQEATGLLGYRHTDEAIQKMIERFKDKSNHPMLSLADPLACFWSFDIPLGVYTGSDQKKKIARYPLD